MATLELAGERLAVLVKAAPARKTAAEDLLKASREVANVEELIAASSEVTKAEEKLTKLAEAKEAVRSAAQVYAADDDCIAESQFVHEFIAWEIEQEGYQRELPARLPHYFLQDCDSEMEEEMHFAMTGQIQLTGTHGHPSTNLKLIHAPRHYRRRERMLPPQADSEVNMLNASAGSIVPLLSTRPRPLTGMGCSNADQPRREQMAMDTIHQNEVGLNTSNFNTGPSFSVAPGSHGAGMNTFPILNEDPSFRKPSRSSPYLNRREGPRLPAYRACMLDVYGETFAMAVTTRLEAAEELMKIAKKKVTGAANLKQKQLHLKSLAKAKRNLTRASEEAANAERQFRVRADRIEIMASPYLRWHRHRQEKRNPQKQGKMLHLQSGKSLPKKRTRKRSCA